MDLGEKRGKSPTFLKFQKMISIFNILQQDNAGQFAMSHGSYDLNLGSKILILAGDIRSRSWPNIGDSYGTIKICGGYMQEKTHFFEIFIAHSTTISSFSKRINLAN
jgi:hypothetical protein